MKILLAADVATTSNMTTIIDSFKEAVQTIQTDALTMMAAAVGAGLVIAGVVLATRLGIKFFRNLANS